MKYNPETHHRKSIRLKYYDYSTEGYYFITICTQNRKHILSKIVLNENTNVVGAGLVPVQKNHCKRGVGAGLVPAQVEKTHFGNKVEKIYLEMQEKYINIKLHDYVIMPNHLHGIIEINNMQMGAGTRPAPTISNFIRDFKSLTTLEYLKGVKENKYPNFNKRIWQRNYYEHVIRNEKEYYQILEYIENNPLRWEEDKYYKEGEV